MMIRHLYCFMFLILAGESSARQMESADSAASDISLLYFLWGKTTSSTIDGNSVHAHKWVNGSKIYDNCRAFILEFSKQSSRFIECSIDNARPFRFCEGCVVHYKKATTVYNDIRMNDERMDDCRRLLLNSDRVQVINNVYEDITYIWSSADCGNCFEQISEDNNGTVNFTLKTSTEEFLNLYKNFTNCVPKHHPGKNKTICEMCRDVYQKMNNLFDHLSDSEYPQHVCMDIVDMMNYTRLMWGNELGCTKMYPDATPIIIIAVIICLMPVAFYVSMKVYGTRREKTIMKQKRMKRVDSQSSRTLYGNGSASPLIPDQEKEEDVANT